MTKKALVVFLAVLLAVTMAVGARASGMFDFSFEKKDTVTISQAEYDRLKKYAAMDEIMQYIEAWYLEETDQQKLLDYAAKGMMAALGDPYSVYYTASEWKTMWDDDEGVYVGIGIELMSKAETSAVTITRVFKGGPAEAAGVRRGDVLVRVEDLEVNMFTMQDAVNIMRGTEGEEVEIEVLRAGKYIPLRMKRATITINRTEYTMLKDNVGLIALHEFAGESAKEFTAAFEDLKARGAQSLIIDLRNNGGGWVQDAMDIADIFLDEGILAYAEDRYKTREDFKTKAGKDDIPLVILVDEGSASSSEILSGGLQDLGRATVVGTKTFGKGIIQAVNGLSGGKGGFALTYAQYFTPSGKEVHKVGIEPDIVSEMPEELLDRYFDLGDMEDPQLLAAWNAAKSLTEAQN